MTKRPAVREERKRIPEATTTEIVDPMWLLKAFAAVVGVALICGYLTLCGLFYRGQWQLVLHPERTAAAPKTISGVPFESIRFGAGATGVPQLTGWWIPAGPGAAGDKRTILYLPGGDGSLANDQGLLARQHELGMAVFAIDYRGYGESAEVHPSERSMTEDAQTAWEYLTGTRGVAPDCIVPYGKGLGARIALGLAISKGSSPAVILDGPDFGLMERVLHDSRARFVPVRLLFHERFDLTSGLQESRIPKLILSRGTHEDGAALRAADPKMTVLLQGTADDQYLAVLRRFLDEYVASPQSADGVHTPTPRARWEQK